MPNVTWTGAAGTGLWSTPGNWVDDTPNKVQRVPTVNDTAIFDANGKDPMGGVSISKMDMTFNGALAGIDIETGWGGKLVVQQNNQVSTLTLNVPQTSIGGAMSLSVTSSFTWKTGNLGDNSGGSIVLAQGTRDSIGDVNNNAFKQTIDGEHLIN